MVEGLGTVQVATGTTVGTGAHAEMPNTTIDPIMNLMCQNTLPSSRREILTVKTPSHEKWQP